jgi:hypothetical protein
MLLEQHKLSVPRETLRRWMRESAASLICQMLIAPPWEEIGCPDLEVL